MTDLNLKKTTINDGTTKTIRYYDKDNKNRIVKEVVFEDKNGNGSYDYGEMSSVSIYGYSKSGENSASITWFDKNCDGIRDGKTQFNYYRKNDNDEYVLYESFPRQEYEKDITELYETDRENAIMTNLDKNYMGKYDFLSGMADIREDLRR